MTKRILHITLFLSLIVLASCGSAPDFSDEKARVVNLAERYLNEKPVTVTDSFCDRSAGGKNDYYSEGDYWWPNPKNPDGAYIRKDGLTNPDNFTAHRKAMRRLSQIVPALVAAYKITGDRKYAEKAIKHLEAWFVNADTKMNPSLLYSQAIKGKVTGRGIGIIDTIHLVEVAKALLVMREAEAISDKSFNAISKWFGEYLNWITTHQFGIDERDNGNNHSTCWAMQVAMFARVTGNESQISFVQDFYRLTLITQMAIDGSFPKETKRTKPYGYSLFNYDAMAMVCEIAGDTKNDLWNYTTSDGRNMKTATEFIVPFIEDKSKWPFQQDVMYWEDWPVRHNSLLFAYKNFEEPDYLKLWYKLNPTPLKDEIIRNYPVRQPLLWIN